MKQTFYISTPIYYPSNKLTLGNCYTTVYCDVLARFHRMLGKDVYFLTGTDEHGQKIAKVAKEQGLAEKKYLDKMVSDIKDLWRVMGISYDHFIRTTDDHHTRAVAAAFTKMHEAGYIYKSEYSGSYCSPCESFWADAQLVEGNCPDCKRAVSPNKEEAYFLKMQPFTDKLKKLLQTNEFLVPEHKVKEMLTFINEGLQDVCVSRTTVKWGIPVPFDPRHTIYVWVDALLNYVTALGYGSDDDALFKKFWPGDIHVVGKEIARFHSIIFPAVLMALGVPLPKVVYSHGWMLFGNDKLSKSKATNATEVLDPKLLVERYGLDAVRLNLAKLLPVGQDAAYTTPEFIAKYNQDLSGNYGNCVSRTLSMVTKFSGGKVPAAKGFYPADKALLDAIISAKANMIKAMEALDTREGAAQALSVFDCLNKYVNDMAPWELAKADPKRLDTVLNLLVNGVAFGSALLYPFIQDGTAKVMGALGVDLATLDITKMGMDLVAAGTQVGELGVLYPRLNLAEELGWHAQWVN